MAFIDDTVMPRVVTLQEAAASGSKAFPDSDTLRDAMPYWTNSVGLPTIVRLDADLLNLIYLVTMRLHVDTLEAGYSGSVDKKIQGLVEDVVVYFEKRRGLQVLETDAWLPYIGPDGCALQSPTLATFSDEDHRQRGIIYPLQVPVIRRLR